MHVTSPEEGDVSMVLQCRTKSIKMELYFFSMGDVKKTLAAQGEIHLLTTGNSCYWKQAV
jgi:hypothetical protein